MTEEDKVTVSGGCHCGKVRFELQTCRNVDVYICNCSICTMKQNHHFVVPHSDFKLLTAWDELSEYKFGTMAARQLFCKTCGIQSFYQPRSNPTCYGITIYCLDSESLSRVAVTRKYFDGQNWEAQIQTSDITKIH